jgi:hypothetical protein
MRYLAKLLPVLLLSFTISGFSQQWGAYTLYSVQNSTSAHLIDTNGTTYHSWTFPSTAKTCYSSYLLQGGTLLRTVNHIGNQLTGGPMSGEFQKVDWNGNVIWDYVYSSATYCTHHDICPMPNGNVLIISYDVRTAAEATQAGCSQNIVIWSEKILEIQQTGPTTGTIVWEWKLWDHLVQNYNAAKDNYYASISDHPELMNINYNTQKDWIHMNGIDYNATLDQITFSSHNINELYVIDHSTTTAQAAQHTGGNSGKGGDLLYRWGNPAAYSTTGTNVFHVAHDAHWIPEGCTNANYLVAFNNNGISNSQSCVDIISPPYNGFNYSKTAGTAYLPSTYSQRIACSGHANNMGNSQQLPNGNTLICIATAGYIYEINAAGTTLWSKTVTGGVAQAFRYSACYVNGSAPTVTAGATPSNVCSGSPVQLSATVTGSNLTYSWVSIPAGFTSTLQNPVAYPTVNTTYTVTVNAGGCTASSSVPVTVSPGPAASITAAGNTVFCDGGSVTLNANTGTGLTYQWLNNGSNITNATLSSYTATESGSYQVVVSNGTTCSATSNAIVVTEVAFPLATITPSGPTTFCQGNSVLLNASSGSNYTYQWQNNGVNIGGSTSSTFIATSSGNYSVIILNNATCADTSDAVIVTVNPLPTALITANGPTTFCNGNKVTLSASAGTGYTWQWLLNGSPVNGAVNQSYDTYTAGTYTCNITNSYSCTDVSNAIPVIVNPLPAKPTISQTGNTLYSSSGSQYQWYFEGSLITDATNQSYSPAQVGNYQVMLWDANDCTSELSDNFYFLFTSVDEKETPHSLSVFPNPVSGSLSIKAELPGEIFIYNSSGLLVYKSHFASQINLSFLPEGIYSLVVSPSDNIPSVVRIVIVK